MTNENTINHIRESFKSSADALRRIADEIERLSDKNDIINAVNDYNNLITSVPGSARADIPSLWLGEMLRNAMANSN